MGKLTKQTQSYSSCFWFLHCSFKCLWFSFTFVPYKQEETSSLLHAYDVLLLLFTPEGVKCLSASLAQPNPQTFANMNGFRDLVVWRFDNFSWNLAKCSLVNDEENFDREFQSSGNLLFLLQGAYLDYQSTYWDIPKHYLLLCNLRLLELQLSVKIWYLINSVEWPSVVLVVYFFPHLENIKDKILILPRHLINFYWFL